jgi:hypothetical protein
MAASHVIYAIIPSVFNATYQEVYVGYTTAKAYGRFKGHVAAAKQKDLNIVAPGAFEHYKYLAAHDYDPTCLTVVPLQVPSPTCARTCMYNTCPKHTAPPQILPNDTAIPTMFYLEARWIHYFKSWYPYGWNDAAHSSLTALDHTIEPFLPPKLQNMSPSTAIQSFSIAANIAHSLRRPDMIDAVPALGHIIERLHANPTTADLAAIPRPTLSKVLYIITHVNHTKLGITTTLQAQLGATISSHLHALHPTILRIHDRFTVAGMVFLDAQFSCIGQFLDINSIVQNSNLELASLWAHPEKHPPPFFTFKSPPPTKPFLAHNKTLAYKHNWRHLDVGTMPPCHCQRFPHLIHPGAGHIITTDYDNLPLLPRANTYVLLLKRGANFRIPTNRNSINQVNEVYRHILLFSNALHSHAPTNCNRPLMIMSQTS